MRRIFTYGAALLVATAFAAGCDRQATSKKVEKVETPGGSTTVTTEKTVESTGTNPPAGPGGEVVPPTNR